MNILVATDGSESAIDAASNARDRFNTVAGGVMVTCNEPVRLLPEVMVATNPFVLVLLSI